MNIKSPFKAKISNFPSEKEIQKNKIDSVREYGEEKIKQINKKILENEVKLESMESHSDYEYNDLLKESNEAEKEHKKDLQLFVDLLSKYKIIVN